MNKNNSDMWAFWGPVDPNNSDVHCEDAILDEDAYLQLLYIDDLEKNEEL